MSSPMGDTGPSRSFQSRLNRVENARGPFDANSDVSVLPDWKRDVAAKAAAPFALVLGFCAVLAVRLGQFHINGSALISATPDQTMAIEAGIVLLFSVLFMLLMPHTRALVKVSYLAGVVVAILGMHNLVHGAKPVFSLAFSPAWSEMVVASTEPNSLLFRGQSIPLMPEIEEKKETVKPTILRLN